MIAIDSMFVDVLAQLAPRRCPTAVHTMWSDSAAFFFFFFNILMYQGIVGLTRFSASSKARLAVPVIVERMTGESIHRLPTSTDSERFDCEKGTSLWKSVLIHTHQKHSVQVTRKTQSKQHTPMFSSQSAELSLNAPCRALAAVPASDDSMESRFLLGSCSSPADTDNNHLHVVRFHAEVNELGVDAKILHETGPVSVICPSPHDPSAVLTAAEGSSSATLWKIPRSIMTQNEGLQYDPEEDDALDVASLATMEEVLTLTPSGGGSRIVDMVWRDASEDLSSSSNPGQVLTMDQQGQLIQWDVTSGVAASIRTVPSSSGSSTNNDNFRAGLLPAVAWDPHANGDAVAVTNKNRVSILDWRVDTSIPLGMVESFACHKCGGGVTDLDYNPNKPYVLATSGQDGLLKFWDLRSARRPLLVARGGHSHWAWKVQYNPFHDQLVLSAGTDAVANLWRLSTISSAPILTMMDGDGGSSAEMPGPNVRVARHEHGDSIYQARWSAADAWVYMVVSYDGKAVLNHVPSTEKYKILL